MHVVIARSAVKFAAFKPFADSSGEKERWVRSTGTERAKLQWARETSVDERERGTAWERCGGRTDDP